MKIKLKNALTLLAVFRANASPLMFELIFGTEEINGESIATLHWRKFNEKHRDVIAFWVYLDDAYKQVFLDYLEKIARDNP